jgi:hypothetical protein
MEDSVQIFSGLPESARNATDYTADWVEYRRLVRRFFLIWLGYVPAVGGFALVINFLFHTFVPAFIFALAWAVWFWAAALEIGQFPCPRCSEYFASKPGLWHIKWWIFARKCQNCGLRKFA